MEITQDRLKALLRYDPLTGVFYWRVAPRGHRAGVAAGSDTNGYRNIMVGKRNYRAHRLAWLYEHGVMPEHEIDHINGNRSDNRLANLRLATSSQNKGNTFPPSHNSSGVKGVSLSKSGRWRAYINSRGRQLHLGYFDTLEEAGAAYAHAAARFFGDFARAA